MEKREAASRVRAKGGLPRILTFLPLLSSLLSLRVVSSVLALW